MDENIGMLQDDDLYIEDENNKNEVLLEEPQISSKSTSKPITNPIITQPIGKRRKPRDTVSEQILNYLDKKNKTCEEKSDEESFALSIIPSLKRMTDRQKGLVKLRIQQTLYEIEEHHKNTTAVQEHHSCSAIQEHHSCSAIYCTGLKNVPDGYNNFK